jgi:PKD repeat protein
LDDVFSENADITRWVLWGDDTAPESWTEGDTLAHVYTTAGTYTPVVRLTDEAGNLTEVSTSPVVASSDQTAPTNAISRPAKGAKRLAKWRTVRGTAADVDGTGVEVVKVRAVQKRGKVWYAYKAPKATWVKAGATKAAALRKSRLAKVTTTEADTWSYKFGSLRKGKLVLAVRSVDRAGNISQPVKVSQALTRR